MTNSREPLKLYQEGEEPGAYYSMVVSGGWSAVEVPLPEQDADSEYLETVTVPAVCIEVEEVDESENTYQESQVFLPKGELERLVKHLQDLLAEAP